MVIVNQLPTVGTALEGARAEMRFATEKGFPFHQGMALTHQGWAEAPLGRTQEGIAHIRQGIELLRTTGTRAYGTSFLASLAEAHGEAGETTAGLSVLAEALKMIEWTDERFYETELYRLKGGLLLKDEGRRACPERAEGMKDEKGSSAEECFLRAIEVARRREARLPELRATVGLCRLWQRQGKREPAREALAAAYGWFTEGHDTPDLLEAQALLAQLSSG